MNYRIIIYNVPHDGYEQAVQVAAQAYKARFGTAPQNVTLPKGLALSEGALDINGLQLEIDRFYASPGTIQIGE